MWLVCGKCRSTWCKCHLSHDVFSPCCPWYAYVGQKTAQSSIKLHTQTNTSMLRSSPALHWLYCWRTVEKFSPTLALLWIRVDTRMVIWYVFDNGKHQTPLSHTLKQRDPCLIFSSTPQKVNLTLRHVALCFNALPDVLLLRRLSSNRD